MTVISVAICTTHSLATEVHRVNSPEEAAIKFTNNLSLEPGELIELIVCNVLTDDPSTDEVDRAFEAEVEKLFYDIVPEMFVKDYTWVQSNTLEPA